VSARTARPRLLPEDPGVRPRGRPPRSQQPADRDAILCARILRAAAQTFARRGYTASSVEEITTRAGMSRRTFYRLFENREDVFAALYVEVTRRVLAHLDAAHDAAASPLEAARSRIEAYLEILASHRGLARVMLVDVQAAGPRLARERERVHAEFAQRIARAWAELAAEGLAEEPHPLSARALVGAVNEVVTHLLAEGQDLRAASPLVVEIVRRQLRKEADAGRPTPSEA
jgi:AcrR family transcriptional regulator